MVGTGRFELPSGRCAPPFASFFWRASRGEIGVLAVGSLRFGSEVIEGQGSIGRDGQNDFGTLLITSGGPEPIFH
jgi:hypothetical protein